MGMISTYTGIPTDEQKLFFKGEKMKRGVVLDDYEVTDGCTIHVHYDLRPEDLIKLEKHTTAGRNISREEVASNTQRDSREIHKLFSNNIEKLTAVFNELDRESDAHVWLAEAKRRLYQTVPSVSPAEMEAVFREMGANEQGHIEPEQWLDYFQRFKSATDI